MSWNKCARIFHTKITLDCRLRNVAKKTCDRYNPP